MRLRFDAQRTYEGVTYLPGEVEVEDGLAQALLHNFPAVCHVVKEEPEQAAPAPVEKAAPAKPATSRRKRRASKRAASNA